MVVVAIFPGPTWRNTRGLGRCTLGVLCAVVRLWTESTPKNRIRQFFHFPAAGVGRAIVFVAAVHYSHRCGIFIVLEEIYKCTHTHIYIHMHMYMHARTYMHTSTDKCMGLEMGEGRKEGIK